MEANELHRFAGRQSYDENSGLSSRLPTTVTSNSPASNIPKVAPIVAALIAAMYAGMPIAAAGKNNLSS